MALYIGSVADLKVTLKTIQLHKGDMITDRKQQSLLQDERFYNL